MSIRAAGRGFARPPSILLHQETLAAVGKFDVTGIPLGYSHITIRGVFRSDVAATSDGIDLLLNGDSTAANYRRVLMSAGTGASPAIASITDTAQIVVCSGNTAPANTFTALTITIFNYANGQHKMVIVQGGDRQTAATMLYRAASMIWENTAQVDQITIQTDNDPTDELMANSQISIELWR